MKIIKQIKSEITRINAYGDVINSYQHAESHYNEQGHQISSVLFNEDDEIENKYDVIGRHQRVSHKAIS